ncbi:diguanylate cyclase [Lacticaseibacillus sp. GG6-2]
MPNQVLALITHVIIILGFTTGFVGLHNLLWTKLIALSPSPAKTVGRVVMPVVIIAVASMLVFTHNGVAMPQTALAYHALAVFMLAFIMLDEGINVFEFILRGLALFGVGVTYYAGAFHSLAFSMMVVFFGFWVIIVWVWRAAIRYHVWRHIVVIWSIAVMFWLTIPKDAAGIRFTLPMVLCAISYSSVAIAVSGVYLHSLHRAAVRSKANAKKATFDALTGVRTYAAFQTDLQVDFLHARDDDQALALITIDIDHFKAVNDHYGHLAGNDILVGIAKILRRSVVASDIDAKLYRTGGEEFTIICRQATAQAALPLARACWQRVRKSRFTAQEATIACTLSCGVAERNITDADANVLFSRADDNLYQSKTRGRDTITVLGQAVVDMRPERANETYTFFTQRIVDAHKHMATVANEVCLGHWLQASERWETVTTPQPLCVQLPFMQEAKIGGATNVSVYLTPTEFQQPQTITRLVEFAKQQAPRQLWVNLREVPALEKLAKTVPQYRQQGLRVAVEVAHPANVSEPALSLIDGIKTTLADLRAAFGSDLDPEQAMVAWCTKCQAANVEVVFTKLESARDTEYVTKRLHGRYLQGYAFDPPELPRLV